MTNRILCVNCWKWMVKIRTGFNVRISHARSQAVRGDEYQCPECKRTVLGDFGEPFELREGMAEQE